MTKSERSPAAAAVPAAEFDREAADRIVFTADAADVEEGTVEQVTGAPREPRTRQFLQWVLA